MMIIASEVFTHISLNIFKKLLQLHFETVKIIAGSNTQVLLSPH
jgi:hypothetical protein